ncbi:hypothetical protein [Acetobacter sp.]|uniref:hypothetical protein n=1 Tax=Acetobacter sp. TaxID=440 RepID=UPI0039EC0B58
MELTHLREYGKVAENSGYPAAALCHVTSGHETGCPTGLIPAPKDQPDMEKIYCAVFQPAIHDNKY